VAAADIVPISLDLVDANPVAAAADFGDAFTRTGFAVVADHGIDDGVIARALTATKALFALPESVKQQYVVAGGAGQRGLTPFRVETAKGATQPDLKEFWHTGRDNIATALPANVWPAEVPDFRPAVTALYAALDRAGARILRAIAQHLDLASDFFVEPTRDGSSILRLLHYPAVTGTPAAVRAAAHEDINVITLLLGADEAGLQLLTRDGAWRDIAAPPGTLVCNIGDMLARLTGDRLPSTSHRVVNPSPSRARHARFSMPFFLHFHAHYQIVPLIGDMPPVTADAFLHERLREIGLA